jgi:hypothetical protein
VNLQRTCVVSRGGFALYIFVTPAPHAALPHPQSTACAIGRSQLLSAVWVLGHVHRIAIRIVAPPLSCLEHWTIATILLLLFSAYPAPSPLLVIRAPLSLRRSSLSFAVRRLAEFFHLHLSWDNPGAAP